MAFVERTREMDRLEARLILASSQWPQALSLAGVELFEELPARAIVSLEEAARWKRYKPGEPILEPGERQARGVCFILEGRVETFKVADNGSIVVLAELGRGQWFGEFAAIDGRSGTTSVRAKEAAFVAEIPQETFTQLMHRYPIVVMRLTEHLVKAVRTLDERVSSLQGFQNELDQFHRRLFVSVI